MLKPIWSPGSERSERANISRFMRFAREETGHGDLNSHAPLWQYSVDHPEQFWTLVWDFCGIRASGSREPVLQVDDELPTPRWFPNMRLNFAQNVLRFDDDRPALVSCGPDGETGRTSYAELRRQVASLAAALRDAGVAPGDHVVAALDNGSDAIIAALASVSIGAVWSCCPASSSHAELQARFQPLQPKVLFADASMITAVGDLLPQVSLRVSIGSTVSGASADNGSVSLAALLTAHAEAPAEFPQHPFDHPLYVLHGSDPTDTFVHGSGGTLLQHFKELVLHADLKREDRILVPTRCGSPAWSWALSALSTGACVFLQEASERPLPWDLIDQHAISVVIADPDVLEAQVLQEIPPRSTHKLLGLKTVISAGRILSAAAVEYLYEQVKERLYVGGALIPAGQIGAFSFATPVLPVDPQQPLHRALGMPVDVLDAAGQPALEGVDGELACARRHPSVPLSNGQPADPGRNAQADYLRSGQPARLGAHGQLLLPAVAERPPQRSTGGTLCPAA